MKNIQLDDFIEKKLHRLIVVCKPAIRNGKIGTNVQLKASFRRDDWNLEAWEKEYLRSLYQNGANDFLNALLQKRLQGEYVISAKSGTNYLLPSRFRRFYQTCTMFETESFRIFFPDEAQVKMASTIYQLSDRNKKDSLSFVRAKIESKEAHHLAIEIMDQYSFAHGRTVFYDDGNNDFVTLHPPASVFYQVYLKKNQELSSSDIENMNALVDSFVNTYGLFHYIEWNQEECVAYNENSIKITGLDKKPELFDKILTYQKK